MTEFLPVISYLIGISVGILMARQHYLKRVCVKTPSHPSAGRFCHICGADAVKNEPCDGGLHS